MIPKTLNQSGVLKLDPQGRQCVGKIDLNTDCTVPISDIIQSVLRVQDSQLKAMHEHYAAQSDAVLDEKVRELVNSFEERILAAINKIQTSLSANSQFSNDQNIKDAGTIISEETQALQTSTVVPNVQTTDATSNAQST